MGSVSLKIGDGTARFRRSTLCSSAVHLIMLASVLTTNLFALYAFTSHPSPHPILHPNNNLSLISDHLSLILREISSSERKLHQLERDLAGFPSLDPSSPRLSPELHLFLSRHPLPLGPDSRSRIAHLVSSVSHSCASLDLLSRFTSYSPFSPCPPSNSSLLHHLVAKSSCLPLPRRRCLTRLPKPNPPLLPFPRSLSAPSTSQWLNPRGKNDFTIDHILTLASSPIRLGLDILGGAADFAAHMAERNVTVLTVTPDASSAGRAAARGLLPLLLTPAHALPFQDGVFDLVHVSRALDDGARPEATEFLMFDIDRATRTGGLLWIDNYLCVDDERKRTVTKLVERFGYKKLKWVVGEKAGGGKPQLYLSAVLQKPART